MRAFTFLFFSTILMMTSFAQGNFSSADWQADLLFLQRTVHEDYPFLFKLNNNHD